MRRLAIALIAAAVSSPCLAESRPEWAFFVPDAAASKISTPPAAPAAGAPAADAQTLDVFNPPDWYPDEHPPMPAVVAHGSPPQGERTAPLLPCALCHLPNGAGHVESASLAGLTVEYIVRQFAGFRSGERRIDVGGPRAERLLTLLKSSYTDEQVRAAAGYYSALAPRVWISVRETKWVPASIVDPDSLMRTALDHRTELLGNRIVELPDSESGLRKRDAHSGFIAYVPRGSLIKGKRLVTAADDRILACTACHGKTLNGHGGIPPLAGRPPTYLVRQLWNYHSGERRGGLAAPMQSVAARMRVDEMLAIAAYLASLPPGRSD
ncbi:MAG TPA: c-type cytochrome [Steroidobacteraceae bacterium]|jgi:cytochrome c553|nr:c-type cytochrome [Steroidobacteraceae bacterium]